MSKQIQLGENDINNIIYKFRSIGMNIERLEKFHIVFKGNSRELRLYPSLINMNLEIRKLTHQLSSIINTYYKYQQTKAKHLIIEYERVPAIIGHSGHIFAIILHPNKVLEFFDPSGYNGFNIQNDPYHPNKVYTNVLKYTTKGDKIIFDVINNIKNTTDLTIKNISVNINETGQCALLTLYFNILRHNFIHLSSHVFKNNILLPWENLNDSIKKKAEISIAKLFKNKTKFTQLNMLHNLIFIETNNAVICKPPETIRKTTQSPTKTIWKTTKRPTKTRRTTTKRPTKSIRKTTRKSTKTVRKTIKHY